MTVSGTKSLIFTDNVTAGRSSRMDSEISRAAFSAQIQPKAAKVMDGASRIMARRMLHDHCFTATLLFGL